MNAQRTGAEPVPRRDEDSLLNEKTVASIRPRRIQFLSAFLT